MKERAREIDEEAFLYLVVFKVFYSSETLQDVRVKETGQ